MDFKGLKPIGSDEFSGDYESNFRNNPKVAGPKKFIFTLPIHMASTKVHDLILPTPYLSSQSINNIAYSMLKIQFSAIDGA